MTDEEWAKRKLTSFALEEGGKDEAKAVVLVLNRLEACERALTRIAKGEAPPESHGHYLAHREAVKLAREVLTR